MVAGADPGLWVTDSTRPQTGHDPSTYCASACAFTIKTRGCCLDSAFGGDPTIWPTHQRLGFKSRRRGLLIHPRLDGPTSGRRHAFVPLPCVAAAMATGKPQSYDPYSFRMELSLNHQISGLGLIPACRTLPAFAVGCASTEPTPLPYRPLRGRSSCFAATLRCDPLGIEAVLSGKARERPTRSVPCFRTRSSASFRAAADLMVPATLPGWSEPVGRCSPHSMIWLSCKARPGPVACRWTPFVDIYKGRLVG